MRGGLPARSDIAFAYVGIWIGIVLTEAHARDHIEDLLHCGAPIGGGAEFGQTTLARFYAIHMLLVPGLIIALIGAHLYLVVKLGTTAPPWLQAKRSKATLKEERL